MEMLDDSAVEPSPAAKVHVVLFGKFPIYISEK